MTHAHTHLHAAAAVWADSPGGTSGLRAWLQAEKRSSDGVETCSPERRLQTEPRNRCSTDKRAKSQVKRRFEETCVTACFSLRLHPRTNHRSRQINRHPVVSESNAYKNKCVRTTVSSNSSSRHTPTNVWQPSAADVTQTPPTLRTLSGHCIRNNYYCY